MQIGDLDQQIILSSLAETNVNGSLQQAWTVVDTVWAKIISQKGDKTFESARLNARETVRVMVRYRDDVNIKWRFSWQSQTYNIVYIDRSNRRNGELWFTAQVVGAL